jgi:hypothetical protein
MGLDVDAYRGLDFMGHEEIDAENVRHFYANPDFPGREGSLVDGYYRFSDQLHVWSSSYSGHSVARAKLAEMVGFVADWVAWSVPETGPFVELINFTDCDGVIGPELCAKLAKDFQEHRQTALEIGGTFYKWYEAYRKGFKFASDGGAVRFH